VLEITGLFGNLDLGYARAQVSRTRENPHLVKFFARNCHGAWQFRVAPKGGKKCPNVGFDIPLCRFQHAVVWILTLVLLLAFAKAKSYSSEMDWEKLYGKRGLAQKVLNESPAFRPTDAGMGVYDIKGNLVDVVNMKQDDAIQQLVAFLFEELAEEKGDISRLDEKDVLSMLRRAKPSFTRRYWKRAEETYATPVGSPRTKDAGDEGFQPTRREGEKLREPGALSPAEVLGVSTALLDDIFVQDLTVGAIKNMHPGITASQIIILKKYAGQALKVLQATGTTAEEMSREMRDLAEGGKDEKRIRARERRLSGAPGYGPGEPFGESFPDDDD